jgi:hypothetical protein
MKKNLLDIFIDSQELAGQRHISESKKLPIDCPKENLESLGFIFGNNVDNLFVSAQFPEGWRINPTSHFMNSDLLDEKCRKRGNVFYKASSYDRKAHMNLSTRFTSSFNYKLEDGNIQFDVFDCNKSIFKTEMKKAEKYSNKYWALEDELEKEAQDFLSENYPDHKNVLEYW